MARFNVFLIAQFPRSNTLRKRVNLTDTDSRKLFEQKIKQVSSDIPALWNIAKGEEWGKRLMDYALSHPEMPNGETRPCIKAIRLAMNARSASYNYTRIHYRVDPETGESIKRETPMTSQERLNEI